MAADFKNDALAKGCLHCLAYFSYFSYPLNAREIFEFNAAQATLPGVKAALDKLVMAGEIFKIDDFYLPENNPGWLDERLKGNRRAMELLNKAPRYARIISSFPFVESIAISGSLSKYYASEKPDIDFFIITTQNRLWIARTLLHLFKKLTFITGHQHYFCMNYFIDTKALALPQRNVYAAIELVTLLPAYNNALIDEMMHQNRWVYQFLPNHPGITNLDYLPECRKQPVKRVFEAMLNFLFPERLNHFFMQLTDGKWRRKWRSAGYSRQDYNRALQTEIHISKNHPDDYEKKVLEALHSKKG